MNTETIEIERHSERYHTIIEPRENRDYKALIVVCIRAIKSTNKQEKEREPTMLTGCDSICTGKRKRKYTSTNVVNCTQ